MLAMAEPRVREIWPTDFGPPWRHWMILRRSGSATALRYLEHSWDLSRSRKGTSPAKELSINDQSCRVEDWLAREWEPGARESSQQGTATAAPRNGAAR